MLNINFRARIQLFFSKVNKRVTIGKRRAIYRVSGLVRRTAINMLRLRPGASRPGSAPHAHTRAGLRLISFAVDPSGEASVIGPEKFTGSNRFDRPVPNIHEFGGEASGRTQHWNFPERPFMSKTLKTLQTKGYIPRQFAASMGEVL